MDPSLQPADTAVIPTPADPDALRALGRQLMAEFSTYESDRRPAEMRWAQNLRQFLGKYDDTTERAIGGNRSKAYPKVTRVKVVSMVSRLMNLLFPSSEKNWTVTNSPVPNLSTEDLQLVLDELQQDPEAKLTDEVITNAVREFAKSRARNLEIEIDDQLTELGGAKLLNYVMLCRKVLMSGVMYGMGVLKGPMTRSRMQRRWRFNPEANRVDPIEETILVPQYSFVSLWDYYPDMSAKYPHQMDGQFERIVMSRTQVRALADKSQFDGAAIRAYLKDHQTGNYRERQHEAELRTMGVNTHTSTINGRKYEIIVWDGGMSGHALKGCGVPVSDARLSEMVHVVVWLLDGVVIRINLNPWEILDEPAPVASYHHFIFEEDETLLTGNGLPFIMRDSQLGISASARMTLDNAGSVCGPQLEVNMGLLNADTSTTDVQAYKVWERDDESPATAGFPAVREIQINSHIGELLEVNQLFREFADAETFVNPATGGDMQKGPSEPFRTAAGASMLRGEAALPFKDVVRQFDVFTESVVNSLILFNKHFNTKPSIKGDFQAVARGSTSLIAKEVRGMGYDELSRTLKPQEELYIDWRKMLKERLAVRDMDGSVMVDDAEAKRREDAQAADGAKKAQQAEEYMRAEIRKMLADAVKSLTQADKNSVNAETTTYNAILQGLEKGVTPTDVAEVKSGISRELPDGLMTFKELENPPPPPPAAGKGSSK